MIPLDPELLTDENLINLLLCGLFITVLMVIGLGLSVREFKDKNCSALVTDAPWSWLISARPAALLTPPRRHGA